jgi:hypothetical protein
MQDNKELFESLFGRNIEDADNFSYLKNIADVYPYFSPAQFYLLLQTKKDNPSYKKQIQKTGALFNNKYWLNYLLMETTQQEPFFIESFSENGETIAGVKIINTAGAPITIKPEASGSEPVVIPEPVAKSVENEAIDNAVVEALAQDRPGIEEHHLETGEMVIDTSSPGNEVNKEDEPKELLNQPITVNKEPITNPIDNSNAITANEVARAAEKTEEEPMEEPVAVPEKENVINDKKDLKPVADIQEETLLFQPFHTSDYFASVGIKLNEEANASDRLGKQLKSFTQWLKTMKKIEAAHAEPLLNAEIAPGNIDTDIQKLAETSNRDDEIITEAMADVLVQQGRIHKAVEVLKKLSLLNPSKSTYFAAKIEQLKD